MSINIRVEFRIIDRDESGLVEEKSVTQELCVSRRGRRWLVVEAGGESGPVGVGYSVLLAVSDYIKNRVEVE